MRSRTTYVYVCLDEGPVPAGRLDVIEDGRNSHAIFQYGNRYVRRPDRVPVDPAALPLSDIDADSQPFRSAEGFVLFNGIRDAFPDGWGRYLLQKAAGPENLDEFDYLVASDDHRVGALAFGPDPTGGPVRLLPWSKDEIRSEIFNLAELAEAVDRVQHTDDLGPDLQRLLNAGPSLGGARPKAATTYKGFPWIAKFSTRDDTYPVCRAEFAVMRLAQECGLSVPDIEFTDAPRSHIYLIQRFDRVLKDNKLQRLPYASALTMLEASELASHRYSYRDVAAVIRRHGSDPARDLRELFRRMAFNILVGNDDDHLRNHAFLFDRRGWRLSPLFDVVPKPRVSANGSLVLTVGDKGKEATLANALTSASNFGLKRDEAAKLLEELRAQVSASWQGGLSAAGVSDKEIARLANSFAEAGRTDWLDNLDRAVESQAAKKTKT